MPGTAVSHVVGPNGPPAARPSADDSLDDPSLYINRELSWLEFNRRVLEEAQDPSVPLLERLKFHAIFSSNLDEFFMVRVGGLQQKVSAGITRGSGADRMPPRGATRTHQHRRPADGGRAVSRPARPMCCRPWNAKASSSVGVKDLTDADRKFVHEVFQPRSVPGPHAVGRRPRPPVPAPRQQVAQPGGAAQPAAGRRTAGGRRASAGRAATVRATAERQRATSSRRWKPSSGCTSASCSPA